MQLYNEDCLKVLDELEENSVDLCVTDCPYHIIGGGCTTGTYGNGNGIFTKEPSGIFQRHRSTKHINLGGIFDDDPTTYARQGKLFKHNDIKFSEWLPKLYRVMKPKSHIYIYISARNLKELQTEAEKVGFKFQQLIVWKKNNCTPNKYYLNSYELILMLRKGGAKNINNLGTKNYIEMNNPTNKKHPTEKPVNLNKILIENSSKIGEVVLDPFMGSGSTGVACKELKRDFIGIEIDKKYFDIAKELLEEE